MSEIRLLLTREAPEKEHTFGVLSFAKSHERICWTMEPGLRDRDFPRVPTGFYSLVPHASDRAWIGATFALVGEQVSHQMERGVDRYAILFHAGNVDDDTHGCLIPGMARGMVNGEAAVLESRLALQRVLEIIRGADRAYLTIR